MNIKKEGRINLIGLVIAGHGVWPTAMKKTAEMIVGDISYIQTVEIDNIESAESIKQKIDNAITALEDVDGIIILLDLFGGSPSHAAVSFANNPNICAITGANVGMLLEIMMARQASDIDDLCEVAIKAGHNAINNLFATIRSHMEGA